MFERLAIPTPFQVGPVNAYIAGRTIVDPGPDSEDALAALEEGLAEHDLAIGDVEQVIVTHAHPDHFGLANRLRERGADVLASPTAAAVVREFEAHLDYEQAYFSALFEAHGMATETTRTVTQLPEAFVEFAPSTTVDRELSGGDAVAIDNGEVTVRELVGHSAMELAFEWRAEHSEAESSGVEHSEAESSGAESEETDRGAAGNAGSTGAGSGGAFTAIVGDHVLPDTTPNPFLQPPPRRGDSIAVPEHDGLADLDGLRSRPLLAFNESLAGLRAVGHDRMLPGHGKAIENPSARIAEILAAHEERTAAALEIVDGTTTAVEVMQGLFPDLAVIDYFPGMSEALGHLDVLVDRGDVVLRERDGALVYRAV